MWIICKKYLKNILMKQWKFWQNVNKWWKSEFIEINRNNQKITFSKKYEKIVLIKRH